MNPELQSYTKQESTTSRLITQPRLLSSNDVLETVVKTGEKPRSVRLGEFERGKLNVAQNPDAFSVVEETFENITNQLPGEVRQHLSFRRKKFEEKLSHLVSKVTHGEPIEYSYVGEEFIKPQDVNYGFEEEPGFPGDPGVIEAGREELVLPDMITPEELFQLGRLKYITEAYGLGPIIAGYSKEMMDIWQKNAGTQRSNLGFILRDSRIAYGAAKGISRQDPQYSHVQEFGKIYSAFINSAMADPIVNDTQDDAASMIYTKNRQGFSKEEVISYLQDIGILSHFDEPFNLLADTASMGTIPIFLHQAREKTGLKGKFALVTLAGGWQGNPLIPNYVRYLASGKWTVDPKREDPIVLKKSEIVHTYAENSFAGFTKRPERFTFSNSGKKPGRGRAALELSEYNVATSLLAWTSWSAGNDIGEAYGMMSREESGIIDEMPHQALEVLWSLWTHSVEGDAPNIAFCPWRPRHSGRDAILARWDNTMLEDIGLN